MSENEHHPQKTSSLPQYRASTPETGQVPTSATVPPPEDVLGLGTGGTDAPSRAETDRRPSERAVQPRRRGSSDEDHGDEKRFKFKLRSPPTPPTPNTPSPPPPTRIPLLVRSVRSGPVRSCTGQPETIRFPQPPRSPSPSSLQPFRDGGEAPATTSLHGMGAATTEVNSDTSEYSDCERTDSASPPTSPSHDSTSYVGIESIASEHAPTTPHASLTAPNTTYAGALASLQNQRADNPKPSHEAKEILASQPPTEHAARPNTGEQPPVARPDDGGPAPNHQPSARPSPRQPNYSASQQQPTQQSRAYPPFVVERLPNWTIHFATLAKELGHAPNARPLGKGVRFIPRSPEEYRTIQRYLTKAMESEPELSWFCYSMATEIPTKVAIRGLPADTSPEDIKTALEEYGFRVRFIRPIPPIRGRPGCLFHVQMDHLNEVELAQLYSIRELLYMPGITIEAWRGAAGGVAQCHRCQAYGHSSSNCHRPLRCVRCGDNHIAADCRRPLDEKPTCANCGKPHTANDRRCAILRREARKRGAKTAGLQPPLPAIPRQSEVSPLSRSGGRPRATDRAYATVPPSCGITLQTAANPPTDRGVPLRTKRRGGGRRARKPVASSTPHQPPATPAPEPTNQTKLQPTNQTRQEPTISSQQERPSAPEKYLTPPEIEKNISPAPPRLPEISAPRRPTEIPTAPFIDLTTQQGPYLQTLDAAGTYIEPRQQNQCHFPNTHMTVPPLIQAAGMLTVPAPTIAIDTNIMGGSAGDPMRIMLGILADLLTTIVAGGDLKDAAMRGLATINRSQHG